MDNQKRVFTFGNGHAEGRADMRNLLGGKGANLAEMNLIGIPVPPGFTITTEVCNEYYEIGREKVIALLSDEINKGLRLVEENTGMKFGDPEKPLLLSVRSGARASMPGMMDTILNLGLNDQVVEGLARKTNNPRFAYDAYRRFVQMYGDVVLELKPVSKEEIDPFEAIIERVKKEKGVKLDNELETEDLKRLVTLFKAAIIEHTGKRFPDDPMEQLWGAICAVFGRMSALFSIVRWKESLKNGEQPLRLWQWSSVIWAQTQLQAFALAEMQLQAKIYLTENGLLTRRVKMLWPVFALLNKLHLKVLVAGRNCREFPKKNVKRNFRLWRRLCLKSIRN